METIDVAAVQAQAQEIVQAILRGEHLDLVITGSMLLAITALSLTSIWRNRAPAPAQIADANTGSAGMMRWLTPRGTKSVTAEQTAIVARPKRKSGSHKTIRVITPVSKVPMKALKVGADPLEIARKSGLSRDAVAMMMAAAAPKSVAKAAAAGNPATASGKMAPARQVSAENAGKAMMAPGAYTQAQRVIPAKTERPGVGTRFNARVS